MNYNTVLGRFIEENTRHKNSLLVCLDLSENSAHVRLADFPEYDFLISYHEEGTLFPDKKVVLNGAIGVLTLDNLDVAKGYLICFRNMKFAEQD